MRIRLLRGRFFSNSDVMNSPAVVVVSQQMANAFWGSEDPIGKMIRVVGSGRDFTVVGVTGDVLTNSLNQGQIPAVYFAAAQRLWPGMDVVIRTHGSPESVISSVRNVLHEIDPELPLANVSTMDQYIANSAAQPRLSAALVALFAGSALLMGVIGIYGTLSFSISQRTREIGVRVALGAAQSNVVGLILREGMTVAACGIGAGLAAAAALARILSSMLFEIDTHDAITFIASASILALAALLACYLPARRAARIDPIRALA